jgi:hypothetical protein
MAELEKLIEQVNKRYKNPVWDNSLTYETSIDNLQPVYFWIIDFAPKFFDIEKMYDNFTASPGSTYFTDLGQRATKMQEEGMKILGYVNTVIKSVLNLIYDLKEFEQLFKDYDNFKSEDPKTRQLGMLSLKQRWMSTVDAKRGMGSLDNLGHQYGFTLLRTAFMAATSVKEVDTMDINDLNKRILQPRMSEFMEWAKLSEIELRKRYAIEKSYLKNQINTLKLYTEWVKPYLSAAKQLGMSPAGTSPSIVSVFGTMILNLEILGTKEFDVEEFIVAKDLPEKFRKAKMRKIYKVSIINFSFRTFPTQQSMHSGRVDIGFKSYALNEDEVKYLRLLKWNQDKEDIFAVTSVTQETLDTLKEDIDRYTQDKDEKKEVKKEQGMFSGIASDFGASLGLAKKRAKPENELSDSEKRAKEDKEKAEQFEKYRAGIKPDTYEESVVKDLAGLESAKACFSIYDVFKKAKGMASFISPFDDPDVMQRIRAKISEAENLRQAKAAQAKPKV